MSASPTSRSVCLGFLAFTESTLDSNSGTQGGFLITNSWGRPVEFRLSSAVQPNQVQKILYGPTLREYLFGELIGKTLLEKSSTEVDLIITDQPAALALREHMEVPILLLVESDAAVPEGLLPIPHDRTSGNLYVTGSQATDTDPISATLGRIDTMLDLAEPFTRVREAMSEARKIGVNQRVA